jgi:hypothetical protein
VLTGTHDFYPIPTGDRPLSRMSYAASHGEHELCLTRLPRRLWPKQPTLGQRWRTGRSRHLAPTSFRPRAGWCARGGRLPLASRIVCPRRPSSVAKINWVWPGSPSPGRRNDRGCEIPRPGPGRPGRPPTSDSHFGAWVICTDQLSPVQVEGPDANGDVLASVNRSLALPQIGIAGLRVLAAQQPRAIRHVGHRCSSRTLSQEIRGCRPEQIVGE